MSSQNVLSPFSSPKFPVRALEWAIAAIAVPGTLAVVAHAYLTGGDGAARVQLVLQGTEMIVATLAAAVIAGALHALGRAMEADLAASGRAEVVA
jgi:hypothetical protein